MLLVVSVFSNISNYQKWNKYFVYSAVLFWLFRSCICIFSCSTQMHITLNAHPPFVICIPMRRLIWKGFLVTFNTIASCNVRRLIFILFILWNNRDQNVICWIQLFCSFILVVLQFYLCCFAVYLAIRNWIWKWLSRNS